ncbi:uncharacterized protein LOC127875922 isoform X3 [Dreissena polymorpha]|uniref:uncharacterized protein LOC127875922 isoform X3 n=1 Tax=Dreissena polymorpha TaxID=45954 RepID=UPI0022654809|nr:uncharacterized protein LOC127875922 isoform X3 [Dreissena polymorpha]
MANTKLPSTIGAPKSQYKIRCTPGSVLIGDREFLSATDALEAYLSQYDPLGFANQPVYKRTVNDLLTPKSTLHMTAERSLETGVRATGTEMRLADQKDAINESLLKMKKSVALKAEDMKNGLEEALNKSQELIRQINSDDFAKKTDCPSDIGSLTTDILVSMNPAEGYTDPGALDGAPPPWKSKHIYGYKRPRARRSKTLSSLQIAHDMMGLTDPVPNQSFTAQPSSEKAAGHVTFKNDTRKPDSKYDDEVSVLLGESPLDSRMTRSPNKNLRERSRSVSPSILKRERQLFESGLREKPIPDYYTEFNTSAAKAPSWVDTMNISDVSDSDWKKRDFTVSKPPPSWVNDIDNSDITSIVSPSKPVKKLAFEDLLRPLPVINTQQDSSYNSDVNDTLPPPGLTYNDLVGDASKRNTQNANRKGSPTLSEKLSNLKSKTTAALQKYHERDNDDLNLDTPSRGSNPYSGNDVPRCSSLDTAALIAGIAPPRGSDIVGASPIKPVAGDNDSTVTAHGSPDRARARRARSRSPDTDIVLEGDRPWEKTVPYKPPVSVGDLRKPANDSQNYSGGSQPGSLEALKNMIFKLQQEAVTTDSEDEGSRSQLSAKVHKLRAEAANLGINIPAADVTDPRTGKPMAPLPELKDYDFQGEPGGQSLEKALVHLDRLKTLVNSREKDVKQKSGVTPLCAHMDKQKK